MATRSNEAPAHPGIHIRRSILPPGLSVTTAAEMLGVGRPALSSLLNGRAALSPDMAMRLEKAFGAEASALLERQARYDEFQARAREDDIAVRAYVSAYLQITARQISAWADTHEARGQLAALLRRLVHSTGSGLTAVDFPAFDNSQRAGWDGQITSGSATPWIPRGQSGWEFGCDKSPPTKARTDYETRTASIPVGERKSTTFVFVTPRNWAGKENWAKAQRARGDWKDVRAFDASDLEQWLEQSVPAQTRMREFLGGASQKVTTLERIWLEWAGTTEPEMPKELFPPGTTQHRGKLEKWLKEPPDRPFVVAADSVLEALAFLSCLLERLRETCPGAYERAVVIRSPETFETIRSVSSNFIAIVASSEVERALSGLQKETHTIIVCRRNAMNKDVDIALDLLGREPFRKALRDTGINDSRIDQLARESARSPTILRRRLSQIEAVKFPPWATDNSIARAMVPLIFAGAWESRTDADKKILECLTDRPYRDTEKTITELRAVEEPPVWSVDHLRGVVSKIDALYAAHWALTEEDLERFLFAAEVVLSEKDPALDLPEDRRWAASLYGKSRDHSSALRRSLCDTLVLLAVYGNSLVRDRLGIDLEAKVSSIVWRLLNPSVGSTWLSQKNDLPQYAEAAPDTFLNIVEADLDSEEPQIGALLAPADNGIFGDCPRSGLLWALELLAWKPKRLTRVTTILAKLCAWQIDDNWTNKSLGSLEAIFRFWMPQTAATLAQRNRALERLSKTFPDVGWQICINQFSPGPAFGLRSSMPRWRTDAYDAGEVATVGEGEDGRLKAIELALDWPEHDERTLGDLVECLDALDPGHRKQAWELVAVWNSTGPNDDRKAALRERIRRCALTRRTRKPGVDNAERERARLTYALLEPRNPVARHRWLFLSHWVEESADEIEGEEINPRKREKRIACQRRDALREVWADSGIGGIMELCRSGDAPGVVGEHMAEIRTGVERAADFLQDVMAERSDDLREKCERCVAGFLSGIAPQDRDAVLAELLARLDPDGNACIRLLCCAPFDKGTWQHVDRLPKPLKQRYWKEVEPQWGGRHDATATAIFVDELLKSDRPRAAFHAAHMDWQVVDSPRLMRLLEEVATNDAEPSDRYQLNRHYISTAFNTLEQRGDVSRNDLARLEFRFIEVLRHSKHGIRNLEMELSESPALFLRALALAYRRNDGGEDPVEWRQSNSDSRSDFVSACHTLLSTARRIPGTQADGAIDLKELMAWLEQARTLARKYGRVDVGDRMIGQLLSRCPPGNDGVWPCAPVREALDEIGSQEIADGMIIGIHNARGPTWREDGGAQERELADRYRNWSREVDFEYPFTAKLLEQLAASYDHDANRWDNEDRIRQRLEF